MVSGNFKWATPLGDLFAESARFTTHDGQKFLGRAAIVNRLNAGEGGGAGDGLQVTYKE